MKRSILLDANGKCVMSCSRSFTEVNLIKAEIYGRVTPSPAQSFTFNGIQSIRDMYCFLGEMIENYDKIKDLEFKMESLKKDIQNCNYEETEKKEALQKQKELLQKSINEILK